MLRGLYDLNIIVISAKTKHTHNLRALTSFAAMILKNCLQAMETITIPRIQTKMINKASTKAINYLYNHARRK
jgi:hypothetical protein